jgi:hypothetical protein
MTRLTNNIQAGDVSFHHGPSLGELGVVFVCLFALSLVVTGAMTGGERFPTPYEPVALAQDYFSRYAKVLCIAAFLQFGAAIPLGRFPAFIWLIGAGFTMPKSRGKRETDAGSAN